MEIGVLGSGFGMYGWLPALRDATAGRVTTLAAYRDKVGQRRELKRFLPGLAFVDDVRDLLEAADALVIAQRPMDQVRVVREIHQMGWSGAVILEKPLAPTPTEAEEILKLLAERKCRVTVGWSLAATSWAQRYAAYFAEPFDGRLEITWNFLAHHYRHGIQTWKRCPGAGGGALRFFAIHLIGWAAQFGGWEVQGCEPPADQDDDPVVRIELRRGRGRLEINCNSAWRKEPVFSVAFTPPQGAMTRVQLSEPFAEQADPGSGDDPRIPYLKRIIKDAFLPGGSAPEELLGHVRLWRSVELARGWRGGETR